jgi:hypothetical protein
MATQYSYLYGNDDLQIGSNESYNDYNAGFMWLGLAVLIVFLLAACPRKK